MADPAGVRSPRLLAAARARLVRWLDDSPAARIDPGTAANDVWPVTEQLDQVRAAVAELGEQLERTREEVTGMARVVAEIRDITGHHFDRTPEQRRRLLRARAGAEYAAALAEAEPLVSVRIATHDRAEVLFGRTLPSVLAQTYQHLEVIVVGDGCGEPTVRHARAVTDPRVRFVNLPHRGSYPEDADRRWLVAGSPAMNHGAQLAAGRWIAPLDDDDEFSPDHVETLLAAAREGAFEMVYGRMLVVGSEPSDSYELGVYPPAHSQFGFQAALYLSALRFFEYETSSWVLGEPGDWNLCRRMLAAGVRIGYVPKVVTTLYPTGPDRR